MTITASETTAGNGTATAAVTNVAIVQPDCPRCLTIKGNAGTVTGSVTLVGKDWAGNAVTEILATNGSTEVVGSVVFNRLDRVILPVRGASGKTISVGVSDKLGLKRPIEVAGDLIVTSLDGVVEAAAAVDAVNDSYTPTTATNGTKVFRAEYQTIMI